MFFKKKAMIREARSSYTSLSCSQDLLVRLVNPDDDDLSLEAGLRGLLAGAYDTSSTTPNPHIFEIARHGVFVLFTARSTANTTNSLDDALDIAKDFIESSCQRQICLQLKSGNQKQPDHSILAVLIRYNPEIGRPLGMSREQQEIVAWRYRNARPVAFGRNFLRRVGQLTSTPFSKKQLLYSLGIVTFIFSALIVTAKYAGLGRVQSDRLHSWVAYETSGSVGPRYQLSITGQNVSTWLSYMDGKQDWILRIDDQAIVPSKLVDDEEKRYQEWFHAQYPEIEHIRLNEDYLNETWLRSGAIDLVPVDDLFHFSHCVLAIRRYIKAKDTGHHVCGRDIDHDHMKHCLDALDWWAFPTQRVDSFPNPQRPFGWRTKVCFD